MGIFLTCSPKCFEGFTDLRAVFYNVNVKLQTDQVRRNLSFLFKHFIVEVREGTKIDSRMVGLGGLVVLSSPGKHQVAHTNLPHELAL